MALIRAKAFNSVAYLLTIASSISLILSILMLPGIDKSNIDSAFYVLNRLPPIYWVGICVLVLALLLGFSQRHSSLITLLTTLSAMYVELPRLMYRNGFQIEYFHQAQIFHVLNYGRVTDPKYPFPQADVTHAIFSAIFINVTSLEANYVVSHLLPILLRLALVISMLCVTTHFRTLKYYLYFLTIAPLYVLISDTEPSFANHYIFVLPLYALFTYLIIKSDDEQQPRPYVFMLLIASAIIFSHIYFATLIVISLFAHLSFNKLVERKRIGNLNVLYTLTLVVIFLLWHGYISEWSIQAFYKELNYVLLPAIDRFLAFEVNPLIYFFKAEERYGSILIKSDYRSLLMLKNIIVLAINIIVLGIIIHALFHVFREGGFKKTALNLLTRSITYLWGFSILFLTIFGLTGTAHPQRVLEAFVIPNCCLALLLLRSLEKDLKFFKRWEAKKRVAPITIVILALTLIIVFFMPFKIIAYWGTSLTYIGFSQKSIHEAEFLSKYGSSELDIHYIGPTPYWFLTEIVNKWAYASTYSLNGQEGEHYFTGTIENMKYSLSVKRPHYVYFSSSSLFAMRAKYAIEPLLNNFIKDYVDLMNKANAVYMNSLTESIVYVP